MATPLKGSKRRYKEPRRRYDLTLNVPGAEVRLPSMPVIRLNWRIASGFLVVLMAMSLYLLFFSSAFQAELLEVDGMQRLTMNDLTLVLNVTGEPVVTLDPMEIQRDLLTAFPDIKAVQVSVGLPASIKLVIEERQPVVAWERGGETVWVDGEGVVFPQRGELTEPLLRVIAESMPLANPLPLEESDQSLEAAGEQLDPKMIQVLLSMSQYMPGDTNMVYNAEYGFGWGDDRGWQVFFGVRMKDIDEKLVIYQAIVEQLQAEGISPALISMEYLHAPYYRMER